MTSYLVTGATGLIGRAVTARLLARTGTARVHAVVRASAVPRLEQAAASWTGSAALTALVGDITAERCGVGDERIAALAGHVDHVVHLAALYDITAGEEASSTANVAGTENVLELAAAAAAGCLHHVSSIAVAGDFRGTFTEDHFDEGQAFPSPYHRTKFAAERAVREQRDVPWRVYRPGVVVGDSTTGEMDKVDGRSESV
jgi:thioester reductase-like protein